MFLIAKLPRDMREEMFNLHAMFVDPEATEKSFYRKSVPVRDINISTIDVTSLKDSDTSRYRDISNLPPVVIADGKLIDGMHRVSEAQKQGLETIKAIDFSGLLAPDDSGYITTLNESNTFESFVEKFRTDNNSDTIDLVLKAVKEMRKAP